MRSCKIQVRMKLISLIKSIDLQDYKDHMKGSWSTSWPLIFIMLFEFLISLTDVYIAGKLGKEYQASVGFVTQIYFIFIVLANAITIGSVSVISRQFASGERKTFSDSVYSIILAVSTAGVVLSILGILLGPLTINIMNIPEQLKVICRPLIVILAGGMLFHYFIINSNGILRATRNVKKSMITMALVCAANIGLNFFLVFNTPLGYKGIALSTSISYLLGSVINFIHITALMDRVKNFSLSLVKDVISIGWPSGLLQIAWTAGYTLLYLIVSMLPENNVDVIAAFTNGIRIEAAIYMPAFAFSLSSAVITGNFLGERNGESAFRSGIATGISGVFFISILTVAVIFNAENLASFLSVNPVVIEECRNYLIISMIGEPLTAWAMILGGSLNGAGDTKSVMIIVASSMWIIRLPLCYFLAIWLGLGSHAIWWSMNVSILVHAVFITRRYMNKKWIRAALL
jgi:putative MATE family efflux protein